MSCIGANIRKIRTVKKLSQAAFAELFGLARPSVGAWEEGRAEPKTDTLIQIAQYFGVSVDLLLTKELTVNDLLHFDVYQHQRHAAHLTEPTAPPDELAHLTPYVGLPQQLAYGMRCQDPAWVATLPHLILPLALGPVTRAFEVGTSEMTHPGGGLRPHDVVVAARAGLTAGAAPPIPGQLYAVVVRTGPLIRRLAGVKTDLTLSLTADNPDYPPREVPPKEVLELWQIHAVLTAPPAPPALLDARVARLEALVGELLK